MHKIDRVKGAETRERRTTTPGIRIRRQSGAQTSSGFRSDTCLELGLLGSAAWLYFQHQQLLVLALVLALALAGFMCADSPSRQ